MNGEFRLVENVPEAFAATVVQATQSARLPVSPKRTFRLACSGGNSGASSFSALSAREDLHWEMLDCYFVDERCVDPSSPESNAKTIADALGQRRELVSGFHPMSCAKGATSYENEIAEIGRFDLMQLGLGPDGHTASLFPGSSALYAPRDRLVVMNTDPSGANEHPRMTLTYAGIGLSDRVVFTVIREDSLKALARIVAGEDLPASRVEAKDILWLVDGTAWSKIGSSV